MLANTKGSYLPLTNYNFCVMLLIIFIEGGDRKMTKQEKITRKENWAVTRQARVSIFQVTYRQALSYLNHLRLYGIMDRLEKPVVC